MSYNYEKKIKKLLKYKNEKRLYYINYEIDDINKKINELIEYIKILENMKEEDENYEY